MNDSGKFWELFNSLYKSYQSGQDKEYKEKKDSEEKKQYEEKKLLEQKKYLEEKQRLEEEKKNKQAKSTTQERFKKLFIARLDTVPTEKRSDIYPRLEKNIIKALDLAKTKSNTTLIEKLSWMLSTLREKMNQDDDEAIIEDLFRL